jgi:hypothetical protein
MTKRLSLYKDVKAVLDQALVAGGGAYELPDHGKAVRWRQRAYEFRKLYAENHLNSPYDQLTFPRLGPADCIVRINPNDTRGVFHPAVDGTPIETKIPAVPDDLQDLANQLAKDLEIE